MGSKQSCLNPMASAHDQSPTSVAPQPSDDLGERPGRRPVREPCNLRGASSEEIREQISQTRSNIDGTIEMIERRLRPKHLLGEMLFSLIESGVACLEEQTRAGGQGQRRDSRPKDGIGSVDRACSGASGGNLPARDPPKKNLGDKILFNLSDSSFKETNSMSHDHETNRLAGQVKNDHPSIESKNPSSRARSSDGRAGTNGAGVLEDAASVVTESTEDIGQTSRQIIRRGTGRFKAACDEYPLAVGVGFAALGALAGLAIPRTGQEDRWIGERSDFLKKRFRGAAAEAAERVVERVVEQAIDHGREAIKDVKETAASTAAEEGFRQESLVRRAKAVVRASRSGRDETLRQIAEQQGMTPEALLDGAKKVIAETSRTAKKHVDAAERSMDSSTSKVSNHIKNKTVEAIDDAKDCVLRP